ncbi:AAA family ATPase [Georgenia deserti]|uniref:AAA family ATPase n=1 Tax=Georgenia deserti TaxID=2093781 RepID=A0ABW4LA86_9MICO
MSRVVFMCGPAGSGKSTVARQLEDGGMTRLSFDQEAWRRGIRSMPLPTDLHREIETELRARLTALVTAGTDVVLDFSFWSRWEREKWRSLVRPLGVEPETIYLATAREVALERVGARRTDEADAYQLDSDLAAAYFDNFEPPTPDEGPLTVIS